MVWTPLNTATSYYYNVTFTVTNSSGTVVASPAMATTQAPANLAKTPANGNPSNTTVSVAGWVTGTYTIKAVANVTTASGGGGTVEEGPYSTTQQITIN